MEYITFQTPFVDDGHSVHPGQFPGNEAVAKSIIARVKKANIKRGWTYARRATRRWLDPLITK